jgi:release factor glutamine methyltransferase
MVTTIPPDLGEPTEQSTVFGHLPIVFDDRLLRPRPWTVAQSRWAAELLRTMPGPARVLELCAGAGHIGLLALEMAGTVADQHHLTTVDVNPVACEYARRNAEAAGMGSRVDVREGRIDDVLAPDERFDLVIADPPWVARGETGLFPEDPLIAIDGGSDGLDVVWSCLRAGGQHLVPGGSVVLQLGSVEQVHRVHDNLRSTSSGLTIESSRFFGARGALVRLVAGLA